MNNGPGTGTADVIVVSAIVSVRRLSHVAANMEVVASVPHSSINAASLLALASMNSITLVLRQILSQTFMAPSFALLLLEVAILSFAPSCTA